MAEKGPDLVDLYRPKIKRIQGGLVSIRVGGITRLERFERIYRFDDAVCATRQAMEGGILPGGSLSLLWASSEVLDESKGAGYRVIKEALKEPFTCIASNAGFCDVDFLIYEIESHNSEPGMWTVGWDANLASYVNMVEAGIIDPARVVISSLQDAASVAHLVMMTEALVTIDPTQKIPDKIQITNVRA